MDHGCRYIMLIHADTCTPPRLSPTKLSKMYQIKIVQNVLYVTVSAQTLHVSVQILTHF